VKVSGVLAYDRTNSHFLPFNTCDLQRIVGVSEYSTPVGFRYRFVGHQKFIEILFLDFSSNIYRINYRTGVDGIVYSKLQKM
jgi:hypothetical protein